MVGAGGCGLPRPRFGRDAPLRTAGAERRVRSSARCARRPAPADATTPRRAAASTRRHAWRNRGQATSAPRRAVEAATLPPPRAFDAAALADRRSAEYPRRPAFWASSRRTATISAARRTATSARRRTPRHKARARLTPRRRAPAARLATALAMGPSERAHHRNASWARSTTAPAKARRAETIASQRRAAPGKRAATPGRVSPHPGGRETSRKRCRRGRSPLTGSTSLVGRRVIEGRPFR
jgi:hypothetical protein